MPGFEYLCDRGNCKGWASGVEAHMQLILQLCAISIYTCTVMNPFMKLLVISCFGLMSKYTDFSL